MPDSRLAWLYRCKRCEWEGRRTTADSKKPCPKCGGMDFFRDYIRTREDKRAEYFGRWRQE